MPGKRMIDESICIDKRLNSVSEGAENLFYRLLSKTDDKGNVFADSDLIQGQIYARRTEITLKMIESRLKELHEAVDEEHPLGLIILYYHKGERFAHFPTFFDYQKLRKDIAPKILYPAPSRNDLLQKCNEPLHISNDPFTQDKLSKDKLSKVSKQEIGNFKKIFEKDKEGLKRHLINRGFRPLRIRSILKKTFGNFGLDKQKQANSDSAKDAHKPTLIHKRDLAVIKAAKEVLKGLSTEALLELYHNSKDLRSFKDQLMKLGYEKTKVDKIDADKKNFTP